MKIKQRTHFIVLFILLSILLACTERKEHASEFSLDYVQVDPFSKRLSALSAIEPELLSSELIPIADPALIVEPYTSDSVINVDSTGNVFVGWDFHSASALGEFPPKFLYRGAGAALWEESLPISVALQADVDQIFINVHHSSGVIYVAWSDTCVPDCSNIYTSRYDPGTGWQVENLHGVGVEPRILIDAQFNATVVWQNIANANSPLSYSGQKFLQDTGWSLPVVFEATIPSPPVVTDPAPPVVTDPVPPVVASPFVASPLSINSDNQPFYNAAVDSLGNSLLVWNYNNALGSNQYGSVEFSSAGEWLNNQIIQLADVNTLGISEILVSTGSIAGEFVTIADVDLLEASGEIKTQINAFNYSNGAWINEIHLAEPGKNSYSVNEPYKSETNSQGGIVIVWFESDGSETVLNGNIYSPTSGWGGVRKIYGPVLSKPLEDLPVLANDKILDKLAVSINENGKAIVSWIDNTSVDRRILISRYDALSGWSQAALVAQVNGRVEFVDSVDLSIDNNDRVYVLWNQLALVTDSWDSKIFLSEDDFSAFPIAPIPGGVVPNTPPLPIDSLNWSGFSKLWSKSPGISSDAHIPEINMANNDRATLNFEYKAEFVERNNTYRQREVLFLTKDPQSNQWQEDSLSVSNPPDGVIKTSNNNNTKNAYVIYQSGNGVFINRKRQFLNWPIEKRVYSGSRYEYDIFALNSVGAFAIAFPKIEKDRLLIRDVQYVGGSPFLGSIQEVTIVDAKVITDSVLTKTDQLITLWLKTEEGTPGVFTNSLQISRYDTAVGWDITLPSINVDDFSDNPFFLLTLTKLNDPMVIAIDNNGLLASSILSEAGWSAWINIDDNTTSGDILMGLPSVTSNVNNDVMLIWTEEEISATGAEHVIYTSLLNDLVAGDAPSWSAPESVSITKHPSQQQSAKVYLADDGNAVAYWPLSLADHTSIMVNKYVVGVGWNIEPEEVRLYQYADIPLLVSSSMAVSLIRNDITISWVERNLYNDGEISVWSATSLFQ